MALGVKSRPEEFSGRAYVILTHFGKMTIDFHEFPEGRPFEIIVSVGAVGSDLMADAAAIGMIISFATRLEDCSVSLSKRLGYFLDKFRPMNGGGVYVLEGEKITSLPSAIALGIKKYLSAGSLIEDGDDDLSPRPDIADVMMFVVPTHFGKMTLDVHILDGKPFEIIVNVGAVGSDLMADAAAIGIAISVCLRLPGSMPARDRIQWFIDRFVRIGGNGGSYGNGNGRVISLPSAVARGLQRFMARFYDEPLDLPEQYQEGAIASQKGAYEKVKSSKPCPECGAHGSMYMSEGCSTCQNCGHSECS